MDKKLKALFVKLYTDNYEKIGDSMDAEKLCEYIFEQEM